MLRLVAEHGRAAFKAIAEYLYSGDASPDVASEALRWLADIGDASGECPGLARRGGHAGDPPAYQRVQQTRFSHVGAAEQGDFGQRRVERDVG